MRIVLIYICAAASCMAQDTARMEQVIRHYVDQKQFMGTVLVAKGDQTVLSKGYGMANLEWKIPNAPDTKFRLGSITKQFTGAGILLLQERGKLNVSDPVSKFLKDAPAAWDGITLAQLLSHTSGIPSFTSFKEYRESEPFETTPEKTILRFKDKPLDFRPGEKWSYSNSGYVLLGYVIEKASGQSYGDFVRQNIFVPLEMKDSGYDSNFSVIERRATGYSPTPRGVETAGFIHMSIPHAAGALYSTTEDLLRWQRGLFGGKLLKPESIEAMTTAVKEGYAFGVGVKEEKGRRRVSHGGGIEGFNTMLIAYPKERVTIAVLGNLNGQAPEKIAASLDKLLFGEAVELPSERKEVKVPTEQLSAYTGTYSLTIGAMMTVTLEEGQLMAQLTNQPKFPIFAQTPTRFFWKVVDAQVEFEKGSGSSVTGLVLFQNGREIKATKN
ncbi:MAG: serine hydrolase [Bryobacteraceae bacterium]|nr:serine hydrolase [Bryobacteraceae bacterium]